MISSINFRVSLQTSVPTNWIYLSGSNEQSTCNTFHSSSIFSIYIVVLTYPACSPHIRGYPLTLLYSATCGPVGQKGLACPLRVLPLPACAAVPARGSAAAAAGCGDRSGFASRDGFLRRRGRRFSLWLRCPAVRSVLRPLRPRRRLRRPALLRLPVPFWRKENGRRVSPSPVRFYFRVL